MDDLIQAWINKVNEINDTIIALRAEANLDEIEDNLKNAVDEMNKHILERAQHELSKKDYNCGTVNISAGGHNVKVTSTKKVKWDQDYLRRYIEPMIEQAGKSPEDFIKYKRTVSENAYKDFTPEMQKIFEGARTVEPSKPTIKIERKDSE